MVLSCGKTYALPQDWPCEPFILQQKQIINQDDFKLHNLYQGKYEHYLLGVETYWQLNPLNNDADCGTSGCSGFITDTRYGIKEDLHFFCETTENGKFDQIKCYIKLGEEYVLNKYSENEYRAHLCGEYYKFVKISDCEKCHCKVYDSRDEKYISAMGCTFENEDKLHCMTGNFYIEDYRLQSDIKDYENCVGLNMK